MKGRALLTPALLVLGIALMWWAQTPGSSLAELWQGGGEEDLEATATLDSDGPGDEADGPGDDPDATSGAAETQLPPDLPGNESPPPPVTEPADEPLEAPPRPSEFLDGPSMPGGGASLAPARAEALPPGMFYPTEAQGQVELWIWSGPGDLASVDVWLDWDPRFCHLKDADLRYASYGEYGARVKTDPESGRQRLWLSHRIPAGLETGGRFISLGTLSFKRPRKTTWLRFEPRSVAGLPPISEEDRLCLYRGITVWAQ